MCPTARKADCFSQSSIFCQSSAASYADNLQSSISGYTLVELMVAVMLAAIASAGIYQGYTSFSASYDVQEQVAEQNQNLRMAMQMMVKDIRMAGYTQAAGAGFTTINADEIAFTVLDDTSGNLQTISYKADTFDSTRLDRLVDGAVTNDMDNLEVIDFAYLNANRAITAIASEVRFVQIALVVRTTNEDYTYTDAGSYSNLQGTQILPIWPVLAMNDNFHRRLLTAEVECRNMGF